MDPSESIFRYALWTDVPLKFPLQKKLPFSYLQVICTLSPTSPATSLGHSVPLTQPNPHFSGASSKRFISQDNFLTSDSLPGLFHLSHSQT